MRKIFAFLCALLLAVQFSAAQRTLYVIDKNGKLVAYSAATVSFSDDVFSFTNGAVTMVTKGSFSASFQVKLKSNEIKSFAQTLDVGVCFSDIHTSPTIQDEKHSLGTSLTNYTFNIYSLDPGTTYYWRPYVKVGNAVYYGEISEETTFGKKPEGNNKFINGHKFVDLGLPSGVLWAETNIGAETAADNGNCYAWGETTTKFDYLPKNYATNYTKYTDGKTVLDKEDDAAYVNWGSSCRMPTQAEFEELLNSDNCTWTWTSQANSSGSSVNGYKVTSKKNGNSIFFPTSSEMTSDGRIHYGQFWSSTIIESHTYTLILYLSSSSNMRMTIATSCYEGYPVRPVAVPSEKQDGQEIQPTVSTQQNMYVTDSIGKANVVDVSSVDFASFHTDGRWFCITDDGIDAKTNNSFSASCTVALATDGPVKKLSITPEVGVCYSKENSLPTINDNCQTLGSSLKSYSFTFSSLITGTTYYYREYIKLNDSVFYGDVVKVKTLGTKPNDKTINGHKFLDLGLPSGLLWAETNIGAETAADGGCYFAWGETTIKSTHYLTNYEYRRLRSGVYYYSTNGKTVLDNADDAAYTNWGNSCRMPTKAEFEELLNSDNCTWTWTSMKNSSGNSIKGYKITSKRNGNSIFLPASGSHDEDYFNKYDTSGFYWSSTLNTSKIEMAYHIYFDKSYHFTNSGERYVGFPVRPVAEP